MIPHKHHDLIVAWAKGAEIEFEDNGKWYSCVLQPAWAPSTCYRIKPEPKPDKIVYTLVNERVGASTVFCKAASKWHNLVLVFDGETGALKKAKVINEA